MAVSFHNRIGAHFNGMGNANIGEVHWSKQAWVQQLLEAVPEILSLCERSASSGGFAYDFGVTVRFNGGDIYHRWFTPSQFNYETLKAEVSNALRMNFLPSVWLNDEPTPSMVKHVVNLHTVPTLSGERSSKEDVLRENGYWMFEVLEKFPQILRIGKAANVQVSPFTFVFCRELESKEVVTTWMKEPTTLKFTLRMKSQTARWEPWDDSQQVKCGLVFERAEVFAFFNKVDKIEEMKRQHAEAAEQYRNLKCCLCDEPAGARYKMIEIAKHPSLGKQSYCESCISLPSDVIMTKFAEKQWKKRLEHGLERAQPEKAPDCANCGCNLKTNQKFGHATIAGASLCGECELKFEEDNGTERTVQASLVFTNRKVYESPAPKPLTKFDPRPGIDDVGLGFYSPTWED